MNALVAPLVDVRADVSRLCRTDIEVAVILWQHIDVVEYETVEVGMGAGLNEPDIHQ